MLIRYFDYYKHLTKLEHMHLAIQPSLFVRVESAAAVQSLI